MKKNNSNQFKSDSAATSRVELGICLEHDDGIVRAQSWLKGTVSISACPGASLSNIAPGELWVDVVGHEVVSCLLAKSVMGNLWNKATRCSNMVQKEAIIFEEHKCIHDFTTTTTASSPCPTFNNNNSNSSNTTDGATTSSETSDVSYHFSIYLPGYLPPSMEVDDTESGDGGGSCAVRYQLRARLGEITTTTQTLTVVGATLSSKRYPCILHPKVYPLHLSPCRSGYLILAARVENSHVGKGCDLHLSLSCRNRSVHWIDTVDVRLLEMVQWHTSGTNPTYDNNDTAQPHPPLHPNQTTVVLASYSNLILAGLQTTAIENHLQHNPSLHCKVDAVTQAQMHNDLMNENNTVGIRLPPWARDSYKGKLVTVSHCIKIDWVVKNRSAPRNLQVEIPIQVFDPPMETSHNSNNAHPPIPSRKIESIATATWVDRPTLRSR